MSEHEDEPRRWHWRDQHASFFCARYGCFAEITIDHEHGHSPLRALRAAGWGYRISPTGWVVGACPAEPCVAEAEVLVTPAADRGMLV